MKKRFKFAAAALAAMLLTGSLAGCGGSGSKDYDFYIFSTKGESAEVLEAAAKAYGEEKGVKVKVFSLGSGTNSDDTLRTEMNSKTPPTIFSTASVNTLQEWKDSGKAMELSKATNEEFKALAEAVPEEFRLTTDGMDNYGIPYNVEGYGYIVDKTMLGDLFGEDKVDDILASFRTATYDEFAATLETLTAYIKEDKAGSVTLSGKTYALNPTKQGKAVNLEGTISMAGSQKWTYGDQMLNMALDAVFPNATAAMNATAEEVDELHGALVAYAKTVDDKSANAIGTRGNEFINDTTYGYDAEVQNFADGKAVFIRQGNWAYPNILKANPDIVDNLTFIPVKMALQDSDVVADGMSVEKINSSITVNVPFYYLINDKASDEEKEHAQDFLVWLNTTEAGQKFVTEDMAFIPYNADPATTTIDNSLGASIVEYMNSDGVIPCTNIGAPNTWCTDIMGQMMMEKYMTKEVWTEQDYEDIADYGIEQWKELKGLK